MSGIVPTIDDSPTIMIDQNELTQRIQTNDDTQPVEDSDSNAYLEEDDEEEETGNELKDRETCHCSCSSGRCDHFDFYCRICCQKFWIIQIQENQQHKVRSQQQQKPNITILQKNTQLIIISDCL